jgi:hypothetical protein
MIHFNLSTRNVWTGMWLFNLCITNSINVSCSFEQTNQTELLAMTNAPTVIDGMRKVCALASTLVGEATATDGNMAPISVPVVTAIKLSGLSQAPLPQYFVQVLCAVGFVRALDLFM